MNVAVETAAIAAGSLPSQTPGRWDPCGGGGPYAMPFHAAV